MLERDLAVTADGRALLAWHGDGGSDTQGLSVRGQWLVLQGPGDADALDGGSGIDTLTGGGPFRATDLMVYKIYADGFRGFDYSGAAAQSIILMLLVMALTFVQFRYVERRVHYT